MGESEQLTATTTENAVVSWSVLNEEIATVDDDGIVTAIAAGTTSVIATITIDGESHSDACSVTVS